MFNSYKRIGLLLASTAAAVSLAACNSSTQEGQGQTEQQQPAAPKEVELVLYSDVGDPEEEINRLYIEPLQKKYPHIKMKYIRAAAANGTTMSDMLASNAKFDIFYHGRGPFEEKLEEFKLMYDMTELASKHKVDLNRLEPTAVQSIKDAFGGKLYGIPVSLNSLLVYYNKTLFDQFGVPYPKDGLTWEETFDLAKRLTRSDGQRQVYGFGMNGTAQFVGMSSLPAPFVDGKTNQPSINSDPRWQKLFQTVFANPVMTETFALAKKLPNWASFSKDHELAMILFTASVPNAYETELKAMNWDMTALPVFQDAPKVGSRANPIYFGVTSLSQNPDAAMEAIKFWTSDEYQLEMSKIGKLMASTSKDVKDALGKGSAFPDKNWGAITYYPFTPLAPLTKFDNKVRSVYTKHLNTLLAGQADLNTAMRLMEEEAQQVIKEELSK